MLEIEDARRRVEDEFIQLRHSVVSAEGRSSVADLFPEYFTETVSDDSAELEDDEENVIYRFSESPLSMEEMERELVTLMNGGTMTVNGEELTRGRA